MTKAHPIFFTRHVRNFVIGAIFMTVLYFIDYRIWKRFSLWIMLITILALVFVLQYGDQRLAAQRALFEGSVQPGEFAKLAVVIYMAAWLSGRQRQLRRISYGLLPFSILLGTTCILLVLQPDLSTAAAILATTLTMFFLAGADLFQLGAITGGAGVGGYLLVTRLEYARSRIDGHLAAIQDLTKANDHVQAAVEAFLNGQLFGVGLGEGTQKFGTVALSAYGQYFCRHWRGAWIGRRAAGAGAFCRAGVSRISGGAGCSRSVWRAAGLRCLPVDYLRRHAEHRRDDRARAADGRSVAIYQFWGIKPGDGHGRNRDCVIGVAPIQQGIDGRAAQRARCFPAD